MNATPTTSSNDNDPRRRSSSPWVCPRQPHRFVGETWRLLRFARTTGNRRFVHGSPRNEVCKRRHLFKRCEAITRDLSRRGPRSKHRSSSLCTGAPCKHARCWNNRVAPPGECDRKLADAGLSVCRMEIGVSISRVICSARDRLQKSGQTLSSRWISERRTCTLDLGWGFANICKYDFWQRIAACPRYARRSSVLWIFY